MSFTPADLATYTSGDPMVNSAQIAYGGYRFPLTAQVTENAIKLGADIKKVPFGFGAHVPPNTTPAERTITIVGMMGTGVTGALGNVLQNYTDLENERVLMIAGMGGGRRLPLYTRFDRYCMAYVLEFTWKPMQDGGLFRYAEFTVKFLADDPRYFYHTLNSGSASVGPFTAAGTNTLTVTNNGNMNAYPVCTFTGAGTAPYIGVIAPNGSMSVGFSGQTITNPFSMVAGDTLVIDTDPRPEHRCRAAIYTHSAIQTLALQYIAPGDYAINSLDFSEFFPFIPPGGACTWQFGMASGTISYMFAIAFRDTFL
jgi:hypothetical protein